MKLLSVKKAVRAVGAVSVCAITTFISSNASSAGDLVMNATITQVIVRKQSPAEAFTLMVTGGSGPCASGGVIKFPATGSASTDDGMRSVAIAAYLAGKEIRAYDYDGAGGAINCDGADYIRMD